ncbi:putative polygalacturonase [Carex littledalei]|uniref:Putative polygalacturonase n=1 Tax=Carex littledalei TaxID=544730 RepID=A0A833RD10_9POAL|nr:putative polygalacturonase [Carex littledalei]
MRKAFVKAWAETCSSTGTGSPTMYVPAYKTFLVKPTTFSGPCLATNINVQIEGSIVAPGVSNWGNNDADTWLSFYRIDGLVFTGSGYIDGSGSSWWERSCKFSHKEEIHFSNCNNLTVSNLSIMNSQQMSLVVLRCENVYINQIKITSPEYSPNTDGIHLAASQNVRIEYASISTDDCISIGDETSNVVIDGVTCGPGHGISIGSLGKDQATATVENINISNSHFVNTTNGARIKTWQGGKGYVRSISYENISLSNVSNPIIIDQYYCNTDGNCETHKSAVQISDVKYNNFWGTSASNYAVTLNCSTTVACTDIHLTNINITTVPFSKGNTEAVCINAYGEADGYLNTDMSCLHYVETKF